MTTESETTMAIRPAGDGPIRERATASVNALVPPTMKGDFDAWCAARGLTLSAGVKALIGDALARDARTPSNAMYRPLPPEPSPGSRTAVVGVSCGCCGLLHDRPLAAGEHCDWCVFEPGDPHYEQGTPVVPKVRVRPVHEGLPEAECEE